MINETYRSQVLPKVLEAEKLLGVDLRVTSAVRSEAHNAKVGGSRTSAHLSGLAADVVPVGMTIKQAYAKLSSNAQFMANVDQLILEPGCIHIGLTNHREARRELREQTGVGQYDLISDPAISDAAREFGVSPNLIKKIMSIESAGQDNARSYGDALGSMQFLESTWEGVRKRIKGLDAWETGARNKGQATRAAAYLLSGLSKKYGNDYLAYAAYGNGERIVDKALKLQKENGGDFTAILAGLRYDAVLRREKGFTPRASKLEKLFGGDIRRAAEAGRQEVFRSAEKFKKGSSSETIRETQTVRKSEKTEDLIDDFWLNFGQPEFLRAIEKWDLAACNRAGEKLRGIFG